MMGPLTSTILTFSAIVGVGALVRRAGLVDDSDAKGLNSVIVYVGLPAFILRAVRGAELDMALAGVVGVAWITFLLVFLAAWSLERVLRLPAPRAGAFILAAIVGNTGYLGYPLAAALLGESALPYAVFSDVFCTAVAVVLVGVPVAQRFGERQDAPVNLLRELATFPAVVALLVGLISRPIPFPALVDSGLDLLANMVAPLIMLSVGMALRPRSVLGSAVPLGLLVVLRLIAGPFIAAMIGASVLQGDALRVAVLQAGMPSMMLTLAVGRRFELDTEFIAAAILVTTIASAFTVPLVQSVAF